MKKLLIILFVGISLYSQAQNNSAKQQKYLPKEIKGLYIGMPEPALKKARPKIKITDEDINGHESVKSIDVKQVDYQVTFVDKEQNPETIRNLYEFIVEYKLKAKAIATAKKLFKGFEVASDRFDNYWEIKIDDTLTLACWIYNNKICIIDKVQS